MAKVRLTNSGATIFADDETVVQQGETVVTEDVASLIIDQFPALDLNGANVVKGEVYRYTDGLLYEVVQSHTTQPDWTPIEARALFTRAYPAGTIPQWVQPLGSFDAWPLNAEVWHGEGDQARIWVSLVDANVWEPGAVGTDNLWSLRVDQAPLTPSTDEWSAGVAYSVGDEVTYQGVTYRCRQAHTSIASWTPLAVPALWQVI